MTAQIVADLTLHARERGPRGFGLGVATRLLRRALVSLARDPLVRYRCAGYDLDIPLSHELPHYRAVFPEYGANLARLAAAVFSKYPDASALDVGANVGDSAAFIRSASSAPILCVEGDERFFEILERNAERIPGLHLEKALVGLSSGSVDARLSRDKGTGHLVAGAGSTVRLEVLSSILERWHALPRPRLLKIDTDGFDCPIIEGAMDTLQRLRPVLFFEYDPAYLPAAFDPSAFFEGLSRCGYTRVLVYENNGDFLASLRLEELEVLEDVHRYFEGRNHARYADLALFPAEDEDVARSFRESELSHFRRARGVV